MAIALQKQWIDRIDDRLDALYASLTATLSTRVVKRSLLHFDAHAEGEIEQGVLMLVSDGESNYSDKLGMEAKEGSHKLLLIGHLKVDETTDPSAIEAAETDLIEEVKSWVRGGVNGMSLQLQRVTQSRQLEHPYGWVLIEVAALPPNATVY